MSTQRVISQVGARTRFLYTLPIGLDLTQVTYGYTEASITNGIAAAGVDASRVGGNISSSDIKTLYITINGLNYYNLASGLILKDLGKTVNFLSSDGLIFATWRLVQRMRSSNSEGVTMFADDVFYVPVYVSDQDAAIAPVAVARAG